MKGKTVPVTWSDEKLTLLYRPGRGSNSRPPAHRTFKHGQGVLRPYPFGHGGGCYTRKQMQTILRPLGDKLFFVIKFSLLSYFRVGYRVRARIRLTFIGVIFLGTTFAQYTFPVRTVRSVPTVTALP